VLTFGGQRAIIISVQRTFNKLTALSLVFLFTLGVACVALAAPQLSIASATQRCPQDGMALGKMDCDQPNFMCSFRPDPASLASAVIPARTQELPNAMPLVIEGAAITGPPHETSLATISATTVDLHFPKKVPIHLFNSVLSL
jgi:hypothetical protein